jgi:DNA-binding transcriptional MerR regulator
MPRDGSPGLEPTYPLRTVARMTGLSPELLRAWERRYRVVTPTRTPGGTRRYSATDLERLRLLKAAVDAGHRIGDVARLDVAELARRSARAEGLSVPAREEILSAIGRLGSTESHRLLSLQLSALGPARFAREVASPLVCEIGERWSDGRMGIAQEHLASGLLRSLLGSTLHPTASSRLGPRVVFATPVGERHELGLLMAALTALGAGVSPVYLGTELPVEDLLGAVEETGAAALALSIIAMPRSHATRAVNALHGGLPAEVHLWLGGAGTSDLTLPSGVERIENLGDLEQRAVLLAISSANAP